MIPISKIIRIERNYTLLTHRKADVIAGALLEALLLLGVFVLAADRVETLD